VRRCNHRARMRQRPASEFPKRFGLSHGPTPRFARGTCAPHVRPPPGADRVCSALPGLPICFCTGWRRRCTSSSTVTLKTHESRLLRYRRYLARSPQGGVSKRYRALRREAAVDHPGTRRVGRYTDSSQRGRRAANSLERSACGTDQLRSRIASASHRGRMVPSLCMSRYSVARCCDDVAHRVMPSRRGSPRTT